MLTLVADHIVQRAENFARKQFAGMKQRNIAQEPEINHMREVAGLVDEAGGTEDQVAAAWLHDTVEDTNTSIVDIARMFNDWIAEMVDALTDPPELVAGLLPTLERKRRQALRIQVKPVEVRLIKLADQISRVRLVGRDPPIKWDSRKSLDYIEGAHLISLECVGISSLLDDYFKEAYQIAACEYA
jgi:(p)ppGpp synthase/HD superfamily hydrolase